MQKKRRYAWSLLVVSQFAKNVVRTTVARMADLGKIRVREDGQLKKYWSRLRETEGVLPMMEK